MTMAKYIDVESKAFDDFIYDHSCDPYYDSIMENVQDLQSVDVAPVVHGEWIWTERGDEDYERYFVCSKCGQQQYVETNYCPDCGAKMDGVKEDG